MVWSIGFAELTRHSGQFQTLGEVGRAMETDKQVGFTPGPWESQHTAGHDTHGQTAIYAEADGKDIAIVYDGEANARLIAAAPELLRALLEVEEQTYLLNHPAGDVGLPVSAWEIVKATIAKARGL
jgi:hypothetical protein